MSLFKKAKIKTPMMSTKELVRWGWQASCGVRKRVGMICLLGVLRVAASLGFVWISKVLIDTATSAASTARELWLLAGVLIATMLIESVMAQASNYITALTTADFSNRLRHRIYDKLLRSDQYSGRLHSGDALNRITVDVNTVVTTTVSTIPQILVMSIQLVAAFWLLYEMSPTLALCALIISPICFLASKFYILRMREVNSRIREKESQVHTSMQEGLQHTIVVQTLECEDEMTLRLGKIQDSLMGDNRKRARLSLFSRFSVRLGFLASYLIAFIWSVFKLHAGVITYGVMTAFLQLVSRIQNPISSLSNTLPTLIGTATAIERLIELENRVIKKHDADEAVTAPAGIRIKGLKFRYNTGKRLIFDDFEYDFKPGSKTVIMGETGVGKSTLTKLILALLDPLEGSLEIYDSRRSVPISPATRCNMVYVPQGNSLMEGTVRDNLLLGNPEASDEELREVLNIAVANFVYDLPQGLDTLCGELGQNLSDGQCQRIAIARALLRMGSVLIFDEFNSSLDEQTASILMERLIASRSDSTIIFISHRPQAAIDAKADILRLKR